MFELYQLRYFLAVVETGSFTKAAARANVTQPTLSAGIKKLEQQLDVKLFQRSSRRVFLTEAGTRFLDHAKAILYECNQATQGLLGSRPRTVLRLGVLKTLPGAYISDLLGDFRRSEAGAVVELFEGTEQEIANRLDEGSIDVAITILHGDKKSNRREAEAKLLMEEGYNLVLARDHPLAGRETVEGHELASDQMVVRSRCEVLSETSRYFTDRNVRPRLVYRTESDERALDMVAAGLGATVMPASYARADVWCCHLAGFDFRRKLGLVRSVHDVTGDAAGILTRFEAFTMSGRWRAPVPDTAV